MPTEKTVAEMLAWVERASYEDLLRKWRFAPAGDPHFLTPEVFKALQAKMWRLRREDPAQHVRASKAIGWTDRGGAS